MRISDCSSDVCSSDLGRDRKYLTPLQIRASFFFVSVFINNKNPIIMKHDDVQSIFQRYLNAPLNRKKFLTIRALSGATLVLGAQACNDDDVPMPPSGAIDVGGGDPGILNFA